MYAINSVFAVQLFSEHVRMLNAEIKLVIKIIVARGARIHA